MSSYLYGFRFMCEHKQRGAVEACWAHNSEVGRSKLPAAIFFLLQSFLFYHLKSVMQYIVMSHRLRRVAMLLYSG